METFAKRFGSLLALVYHCFDRIVILGHLPLLTRPENIVHFFRDIHQVSTISKEALRQRTDDYHRWVEAFAKKRKIPMEWAEKGVRKEDSIRPHLRRMERRHQFGVYFILKSMELGPLLSLRRSQVSGQRSPLPHPRSAAFPLHSLLLLHSRRSAGADRLVRGIVPPLFRHLLSQWPSLPRTRTGARR